MIKNDGNIENTYGYFIHEGNLWDVLQKVPELYLSGKANADVAKVDNITISKDNIEVEYLDHDGQHQQAFYPINQGTGGSSSTPTESADSIPIKYQNGVFSSNEDVDIVGMKLVTIKEDDGSFDTLLLTTKDGETISLSVGNKSDLDAIRGRITVLERKVGSR